MNKIIKGATLGFIPSVGGAVGFVDSRAKSRTSKLGKDLEKKIDRLETKIDRNQEIVMNILLALSADVALLKGADSKKK